MSYVLHSSQNTNRSVDAIEIIYFVREPEIERYYQYADIITQEIWEQYS